MNGYRNVAPYLWLTTWLRQLAIRFLTFGSMPRLRPLAEQPCDKYTQIASSSYSSCRLAYIYFALLFINYLSIYLSACLRDNSFNMSDSQYEPLPSPSKNSQSRISSHIRSSSSSHIAESESLARPSDEIVSDEIVTVSAETPNEKKPES